METFRRLSLCMIVKDEELFIGRCLESVQGIVDEMIIVDTGSSDRTVEICEKYGATVHHFPWNGSFSDARNFGIEKATGDWILWLDADEEVKDTDKHKLRDALYVDGCICSYVILVNYYGTQDKYNEDDAFVIGHPRLFKNHEGIKFINPVHEMLNVAQVMEKKEMGKKVVTLPIKVHHYGYLDDVAKEKNKSDRNLKLLMKELAKEEHDPWIEYHVGSEYYRLKDYDRAFQYVNKSILAFLLQNKKPPSLLYKLKYTILLAAGSTETALDGIEKAILMYPDYIDLHFYKGLIQFANKKYEEAITTFTLCTEIGEDNLEHLVLKGAGGFQSVFYKGECYQKLGQLDLAKEAYLECLRLSPTCKQAMEALEELKETVRASKLKKSKISNS